GDVKHDDVNRQNMICNGHVILDLWGRTLGPQYEPVIPKGDYRTYVRGEEASIAIIFLTMIS
ncbi:MAG: hypothetical protein RIQ51_700, partial [Bacteroidota bacterium]